MHQPWEELSTTALTRQLFRAHDLPDFLERNEAAMESPTLSEYLHDLCREKKLPRGQVIRASGLERTFGYQVFNGRRRPSRENALRLAFAMGLTVKEAQRLLRLAKQGALYPKVRRDAVLLHCLHEGTSLPEAQEVLEGLGLTVLGDGDGEP